MRSHLQTSVVLLAFILSVSALEHAQAEDASGWRGPTREVVASAFEPPSTWPKSLKKVWQVEVGVGHASPVVVGNHIFQFSRQDEKEVLRCLDLNGKEVWQHAYPAPYKMNNAARGHGKGPKSTP